ncbi:MAG: tRNA epoxyqueuosine(34) reductase QueG [Chloroflexota bacterium]|nr:tRNA epoxyqueuosine(34) reductase QueG [Chloroflexota bacterium]MDE2960577.1 tRNA epoxyqueuosine(34) reductase QueG [Chloroflexota bacterium]
MNAGPHISVDPAQLRHWVDEAATNAGFDLVAVASAEDFASEREEALRRIDDGLMDGLPWFNAQRVQRGTDPETLLPGARSIISLGWNYYPAEDPPASGAQGLIARYARGRDYHRVMKRRMRRMVLDLAERLGEQFAARWYVDDGPMLDRAAAARAGLGWFGKNGNILNPTYGSWLLLGQIITDLPLAADPPLAKTCGQCSRCLPACPTDAIVAPYVVDNRRCISYLTIEHKGAIPIELRAPMGNWVFGCDICQEVCPVNRKAKATRDPNFGRTDLAAVDLVELLEMTEEQFRERFAGTPIMRAKRVGMQRNACVALGNSGDTAAVPALARALRSAPPLVRAHAAWALGRIGGPAACSALVDVVAKETDAEVIAEIRQALGAGEAAYSLS